MYKVFKVFVENNKLKEYFYGAWEDAHTANEIALQLRDGTCFSTIVRYVED